MLTVGEVARASGVSVRTLHHYDAIGLLCPSHRDDNGYRRYDRGDVERLQEILGYRALGFSLEETGTLLDAPDHDRVATLRRQRELLLERAAELGAVLRLLDRTLAAHEEGREVEVTDMFDGFDPDEHAEEAEQRWGDTEAWQQSKRRTSSYGEREWRAIREEMHAIQARIGALFSAGEPADSQAARSAVEAHRQHIEHWFYDCPPQMQVGLGEMYVTDPRFTATYDDAYGDGCAAWVRDAIVANAAAS